MAGIVTIRPQISRLRGTTQARLRHSAAEPNIIAGVRTAAFLLALVPIAVPAPTQASTAPSVATDSIHPPPTQADGAQEVWLALQVNHQEPAETVLTLRRKDGSLLARGEDLRRHRLKLPDTPSLMHHGDAYYGLDTLPGLKYQVDEPNQALFIEAPPELFQDTAVSGLSSGFAVPSPSPPGGFFNYDISASHTEGRNNTAGLFELGAFNGWGVGAGSFLTRDLNRNAHLIRLDTTWTRDLPAQVASLRAGDAISAPGSWGRSVRFGGLQWASNFAVQPGLITFPQPSMTGEAVIPSTVDLYVNDALRLRREVPAGPFSITDLPVITGQGEARLVVRDLLGREQVLTAPYYATPRLLRSGLQAYSYELGFVRNNYGIASNDYGRFMVAGTHRLGFTNQFTGEVRGEFLRDQQSVGLSNAWLLPAFGVLSGSIAASRSNEGTGKLLAFGFERQSARLSFGGNIQLASERFTQIGLLPGQPAPKQLSQAFASIATVNNGSFGLSYVEQDYRDRTNIKLVSASYSMAVAKLGFLSFSVLRSLSGDSKTAVALVFTRALDERTTASVNANRQADNRQALLQVQRNLPAGSGVGYRLLAGAGDADRLEAGVSLQNNVGTYSLEAARFQGQTGFRGNASGGIAVLKGDAFLSRRIDDSFAVVKVPDYPNVRIYADNQIVGQTDASGSALLPRLRPYQKNPIRIEQADLPLDAQIDSMQLDAVPYFRSGALLQFPIKRSRGALLTIVLDQGDPLPAGAMVQILGQKEEFPSGLRGEVYLTGLEQVNRLQVNWRGQRCEIALTFPVTSDPLPHLGTHVCSGVKP